MNIRNNINIYTMLPGIKHKFRWLAVLRKTLIRQLIIFGKIFLTRPGLKTPNITWLQVVHLTARA
ncbi:hypothetical protein D770_26870 [Flammeovirgaceae bacterium 311]|nr:hypothetical protein D770_26870 [Flammeovirgaceae bacterium 311]